MAILVLGDFFFGYNHIPKEVYSLSKYIQEHNYSVILNLEGVITDCNNKVVKRGEHLRQSKLVVDVLKLLNVKGVTLANNHIMDFGIQGLIDTIKILDENNIQHTGAGATLVEAIKPIRIKDSGEEYYFYALTDSYEEAICIGESGRISGCVPIDEKLIRNTEEKSNSVLILHTGFEYNTYPMLRNIKQTRSYIDLGFKSVICMHPHVMQPIMFYRDKLIAFSLGNFYFSQFRDEFYMKNINNHDIGYCNNGLGVIFNGKLKCNFIGISVLNNPDSININENIIVENISRTKFTNKNYFFKCIKNRNNHNPILLGINSIDFILLRMLDLAYFTYKYLKKYNLLFWRNK